MMKILMGKSKEKTIFHLKVSYAAIIHSCMLFLYVTCVPLSDGQNILGSPLRLAGCMQKEFKDMK